MRRSIALLLLLALPRPADAQKRIEEVVVADIVATGGVAGELAQPRCHAGGTLHAAEFANVAAQLPSAAEAGAFILDTGGLLARHGVARYASVHEEGRALAEMVENLGYRALAFSEADLGDPRHRVVSRTRALRQRGIPTLATNVRCDEEARELCEVLVNAEDGVPFHAHGEERLALFSFLDPAAGRRVAPDRMRGVHIAPLEESIRVAVRAARARGATMVIAVIDAGQGAEAAARALSITAELADDDKPDLVFAAGAGSELLFARPRGFRPAIVAAPPRGAARIEVRRSEHSGLSFMTTPVDPGAHPAGPIGSFIGRVGGDYCEDLGEHLAGGFLDPTRELNARGMAELTAASMREVANGDVALLNLGAIDARWSPADPVGLTEADVQIAIQYDEPLMVATVSAFWLKTLARSNPEDRSLLALGLEITNPYGALERVKINGRILDDDALYRVVTIRFLAEGGDDRTVPEADWSPIDHSLREALLSHLQEEREEDPRDAIVDPWERLEWTLNVNTDLTFAGSAVRDSGDYQEGPLTNARQTAVGFNAVVGLNALSRTASWENQLTGTYTLAATSETDGFDEGADTLTYRTTGAYRGFRRLVDELYVPDLLVEGLLRTEFSPQDDEAHFMNVRFVGGLQWRLHLKVKIKLTSGIEVLQALDDDERSVEPGVGAQLDIQPWILMREGLRRLTLTTNFDYFVSGIGNRNRHLLQGLFDLALNLNRYLALSLNVTLYGLAEEQQPFSFAMQTTAALRVSWTVRAVQQRAIP